MEIRDYLPLKNKNASIEYRLFESTLLVTIGVFIAWLIVGVLVGYGFVLMAIYTSCLVMFSALYIALKSTKAFNVVVSLYYLIALGMLALSWFPTGGVTGAILHIMVLVYISGLLVLPARVFLIFIAVSGAIVISLSMYEFFHPTLAVHYQELDNHVRDLSISGIITLVVIGACLFVYKHEYAADRKKLSQTISELAVEKERAQSADKAKSDFLATISHEIRTPLNGVVGISELLKGTPLSPEQQHLISNLTYSSELLHGLISDLLDVTLIESGKLVLQENNIRIKEEIASIIDIVKPRLDKKEKDLELNFSYDESIPEVVRGDVLRFRQVLLNLVNNAIKFTSTGEIVVLAKLKEIKGDDIWFFCCVKDTGVGISEEGQKQLFSKFFKANTNSSIEGTGLGLSICKKLITRMGGTIGFKSTLGEGSEFYFEVPFKPGKMDGEELFDEELKEKPLTDITILVVEDVQINQVVITKMLESFGLHTFDIAENGEVAVKKAAEKWYDIILMDVQMPVMDGLTASENIKAHFQGKSKPIILAITANAVVKENDAYQKAGIDGFLSKPITKEALRTTLRRFI